MSVLTIACFKRLNTAINGKITYLTAVMIEHDVGSYFISFTFDYYVD